MLETRSETVQLTGSVSWEVDLWGRIRQGSRAATAELAVSHLDLLAARRSLAANVTRLWLAGIEIQERRELLADSLINLERTERHAESRYRRGIGDPVDLELARSQTAGARGRLRSLDRENEALRQDLRRLVADGEPVRSPQQRSDLPTVELPPPADLPADVLERRPDVRTALYGLRAADARTAAAERARLPRLNLTGSLGLASDALRDLVEGDFSIWSLAAGLLQPIFQGGRLAAEVELAEAGGDVAAARLVEITRGALAEVEKTLDFDATIALEIQHARTAADRAGAAHELAERRYRRGVGTYLALLTAQRQALAAEETVLALQAARSRNRVDLHLALGWGLPDENAGPDHTSPSASASGTDSDSEDRSQPGDERGTR